MNGTSSPRNRTACSPCRARIALTLARTFNRTQVAQLISAAMRTACDNAYDAGELAGREDVAAIMLDGLGRARDVPPLTAAWARREEGRQNARREHDTAARWPWRGDHPGGPILTDWDGTPWEVPA